MTKTVRSWQDVSIKNYVASYEKIEQERAYKQVLELTGREYSLCGLTDDRSELLASLMGISVNDLRSLPYTVVNGFLHSIHFIHVDNIKYSFPKNHKIKFGGRTFRIKFDLKKLPQQDFKELVGYLSVSPEHTAENYHNILSLVMKPAYLPWYKGSKEAVSKHLSENAKMDFVFALTQYLIESIPSLALPNRNNSFKNISKKWQKN